MAKLYFRHGAMGSSKTANALMVEYNYYERGKRALLVKPRLDDRDGERVMCSRMGLSKECGFVEELVQMSDDELMADFEISDGEIRLVREEEVSLAQGTD